MQWCGRNLLDKDVQIRNSRFRFWRTIGLGVNLLSVDLCAHSYPKLAAFLDIDPNFMIYRRFGYLRTRLLLYHQDVLRELELKMDRTDRREANDPATERRLCCREEDDDQKELLLRIGRQLQTYGRSAVDLRCRHLFLTPGRRTHLEIRLDIQP